MNNRPIKFLLGLCSLMLGILMIEKLIMTDNDDQTVQSPSSENNKQADEIELPPLKLANQSLQSYTDMIDKPLFIEGRKPVVDDETDSAQQEDVSQIEDFVLEGIYSINGKMLALFRTKKGTQKYLKRTTGDDVSGWLLKEVMSDRVILERAGNQQTLKLRKPKPKNALPSRKVRPPFRRRQPTKPSKKTA